MSPPSPLPTYIYKILPTAPPQPLPAALPLSELDQKDGFIHLSTSDQVAGTASRFFTNATKLWILKLRLDTFPSDAAVGDLGQIKWESAKSHGTFPHLYSGDLGLNTVQEVLVFERKDGEDWNAVLGSLEK